LPINADFASRADDCSAESSLRDLISSPAVFGRAVGLSVGTSLGNVDLFSRAAASAMGSLFDPFDSTAFASSFACCSFIGNGFFACSALNPGGGTFPGVVDEDDVSVCCVLRGTRMAMAGTRLERGPDGFRSCLAATALINAGVMTVAPRGADMLQIDIRPKWKKCNRSIKVVREAKMLLLLMMGRLSLCHRISVTRS
jgi:hypothetical protein